MWGIVWINLFELPINDAIAGLVLGWTRVWTHLETLHIHPFTHPFVDGSAHSRDQKRKADKVREKSGRKQQSTRKQDHCTMGEIFSRVLELGKRAAKVKHCLRALGPDHPSAQNRGQNDDRKGPAEANRPTHLDEKRDFEQWNADKEQ